MKKVIIGIITKHFRESVDHFKNTYIVDNTKQAIFDNGGIAIGILPSCFDKNQASNDWKDSLTLEEKENIIEQINLCNGIILQGGGRSEEYECFIAKYCYEHDIPCFGICAGKNNMVRAVGGKILRFENIEAHKSSEEYVHDITIHKDSLLYKIIGKERIKVNSRHKRYTSDPSILQCSSFSDDGVIESVEDKNKKFYLAVQFHPESLYRTDKNMNNLFKYFINICKN